MLSKFYCRTITSFVFAFFGLTTSVNVYAYFVDMNLDFANATYEVYDLDASGNLQSDGMGGYLTTFISATGATDRLSVSSTSVGSQTTWTIAWGDVNDTNATFDTSSFEIIENDHLTAFGEVTQHFDAGTGTYVAGGDAGWDYTADGYRNYIDVFSVADLTFFNGVTDRKTNLLSIQFTDPLGTYWTGNSAGAGTGTDLNFGGSSPLNFGITSTTNSATPLENPANDDTLCATAESFNPDTGSEFFNSCAQLSESDPPSATGESFQITAFMGSLHFAGFIPTSPEARVENIYPDGTVDTLVAVPEPQVAMLFSLGLLIMGIHLKRKSA